jgi:hypothetical protein
VENKWYRLLSAYLLPLLASQRRRLDAPPRSTSIQVTVSFKIVSFKRVADLR